MAHGSLIASLVGEAKAQLVKILDTVPGESDPFKLATIFLAAKHHLGHLESLVNAINDPCFSHFLTGASRAQEVSQGQSGEADRTQGLEDGRPQGRPGKKQ